MIRVSMVLDSKGRGVKLTTLAEVTITNDGTGTVARGNYDVTVKGKDGKRVVRLGRVEGHARNAHAPLVLLRKALESAGY